VRAATATIVPPDDRQGGEPRRLTLSWVGEDTLEARFPLQKAGTYLGAVQVGAGAGAAVLPLAPLSLPYSPEFEPRSNPQEGRLTLSDIARLTGGIERTAWDDVFTSTRVRNRQFRDLVIPLALMLLLAHVIEIGGRRLFLFAAASAWLRHVKIPRLRRAGRKPVAVSAPAQEPGRPSTPGAPDTLPMPETPSAPAAPPKPAVSPLARAKAKSRERMRR
jgi:hypothetical protein